MPEPAPPRDFIRRIVAEDVASGKHEGRVVTRFPPEPNGYLHIGHAKSICLNFGIAREFDGRCNLRMDDTNPTTEDAEYVEAIQRDIRWLGFTWDGFHHASDYFEQIHDHAVRLIQLGKAYVCSLSAERMSALRGTPTTPGTDSPDRDRSIDENLDLFARMRAGEFADGTYTLRAKIDMASPNMNLRDPVMFRIRRAHHYRTGDRWCIYPMYDYAHCVSDSIEGITHSLCTLEFEHHRPLYDWFLEQLAIYHPQQIEFARLNLDSTIMSKRKLLQLVEGGHVSGWDDPRLPTLSGMRRRGYTPEAIRAFAERIGVAKFNSTHEMALLEFVLREDLNRRARRAMAVLDPLKLVLVDWPQERVDELQAIENPEDPTAGTRVVPFGRTLWIERDDFMEDPPKKFFRLAPGAEVRLRYGYIVKCETVVKNADGRVVEVHCTHDPASRSDPTRPSNEGRKVKGTIHWVSAAHAIDAEVRLYDTLLTVAEPDESDGKTFLDYLNPNSLVTVTAKCEPSLAAARAGTPLQFERLGYFCVDAVDSTPQRPVFNRTVTLRDTWAKLAKAERA